MADNKKKKVSFAEGLQAQAAKILPPKQGEDEVITVDLDGVEVPVARGKGKDRLSDAEWEQVKRRAAQPVENVDPKAKEHSWSDIMSIAQDVKGRAKGLVSPEEAQLLEKTNEWDRAEFLRQRMKNKGYKVPINSAQDERDSLRGEKSLPAEKPAAPYLSTEEQKKQTEQWKKDQGKISKDTGPTPDEWAPMPEPAQKGGGTQTEDTVSSAGPGMSPRANMQAMMMGATPKQSNADYIKEYQTSEMAMPQEATDAANFVKGLPQQLAPMEGGFPGASNPAPATGGFPGLAGGDAAVAQANAKGEQNAQNDMQAIQAANATVGALGRGVVESLPPVQALRDIQSAGDKFGRNLAIATQTPNMTPAELDAQDMIAAKDPGVEYDPSKPETINNFDPTKPNPKTPIENFDPTKDALSLALASSGGGGFTPAHSDPQLAKNTADSAALLKKAQEDAKETQAGLDIVSDALVRKGSERRLEVQKLNAMEEKLAVESRLTAVKEADRIRGLQSQAQAEAEAAARVPTDPNRYWNNKTEGQRAAAIIAGAMFGFTGQGMQWLQRIDGLIEGDMRAQQTDRAAKVQGLESKARGLGEAANWAMQKGASEAEAMLLSRQMRLDGLKSYLEDLTAQQSNVERKMRGQQMLLDLGQQRMQVDAQLQALGEQKAHNENQVRYQNAELGLRANNARLALVGKMLASQKENTVKGPQAMELGALAAAEKVAQDLKTKFGEKNILSRFLDKGASWFPGTDAKNYNIAREQAINMIAPMMGAGVLQKHDLDRWEGLMAKAGDVNGEETLKVLVQDIQRTYNEKLGALGAAGMSVHNFQQLGGPSSGSISFTPARK